MLDIFSKNILLMKHAKGISFGNTVFYKKNIKLPLLKNLHFPTKKNRTVSVFMLE